MRRVALSFSLLATVATARADPATCSGFREDVAMEATLMRTPAQAVAATTNVRQAGLALATDVHYLVWLSSANTVAFIAGKVPEKRDASTTAGILYFAPQHSGRHRFSLDTRHWVDVVVPGPIVISPEGARVLEPVAHDHGDCPLLHKVLTFDLEAGTTYEVHLSGRPDARVNFAITRETR